MPAASAEDLRLALAVTVVILVVLITRQALLAWLGRRRLADRMIKARRGETRARALLEARGYSVRGVQFAGSYTLAIDGEELVIPLRADYLVARDGLRYVAEVKTGALAPHLRTPATRRQLLEYRVAFDVDGVLLVDAEQERIHIVRFPLPEPRRAILPRVGWIAIAIGAALLIAAQWR